MAPDLRSCEREAQALASEVAQAASGIWTLKTSPGPDTPSVLPKQGPPGLLLLSFEANLEPALISQTLLS